MTDRASKYTIESKKVLQYTDFMNNLDKNPLTGFLAVIRNEEAVKQSIRNIVLTERTERFHQPWIGSKIHASLFEPLDSVTAETIKMSITEAIENGEPRALLLNVSVEPREELNSYFVNIHFAIQNIQTESFNLNLILRRVR